MLLTSHKMDSLMYAITSGKKSRIVSFHVECYKFFCQPSDKQNIQFPTLFHFFLNLKLSPSIIEYVTEEANHPTPHKHSLYLYVTDCLKTRGLYIVYAPDNSGIIGDKCLRIKKN